VMRLAVKFLIVVGSVSFFSLVWLHRLQWQLLEIADSFQAEVFSPHMSWPPPDVDSNSDIVVFDVLIGVAPEHGIRRAYHSHRSWAVERGYAYRHFGEAEATKILHMIKRRIAYMDPFPASSSLSWSEIVCSKPLVAMYLLENFTWTMSLDGDAAVVDMSVKLEPIISHLRPTQDLVFSGDTNFINSGVILYRKSAWMMALLQEFATFASRPECGVQEIGMEGDNAVLAVLLSGCDSHSSREELLTCYAKADRGYKDATVAARTSAGDPEVVAEIAPPVTQPHLHLMPQRSWQAYSLQQAGFILHFPGYEWKRQGFSSKSAALLRTM